jgi:hypothetical protein
MLQVKTIKRGKNPWWKQLYSTTLISLEEYEKDVNEFCKTVKVVSINTSVVTQHKLLHTVVYDDGSELK